MIIDDRMMIIELGKTGHITLFVFNTHTIVVSFHDRFHANCTFDTTDQPKTAALMSPNSLKFGGLASAAAAIQSDHNLSNRPARTLKPTENANLSCRLHTRRGMRHKAVLVLTNAEQQCSAPLSGDNAECGLRSWSWTTRPMPDQKMHPCNMLA